MLKSLRFICLLPALAGAQARVIAADLTDIETRWLSAGMPVIAEARQAGLPLDIIVQPQAAPGAVPLALGFSGGRCKLVLSMRANADAESVLRTVPVAQHALMIGVMTAHEIGHCRRYAQGDWHVLPSGFIDAVADSSSGGSDSAVMAETRREEAFADLAALAWTQMHHPAQYGVVHVWMTALRRGQAGGSHDTLPWLRLARDGSVFAAADASFEQVQHLWRQGLIGIK